MGISGVLPRVGQGIWVIESKLDFLHNSAAIGYDGDINSYCFCYEVCYRKAVKIPVEFQYFITNCGKNIRRIAASYKNSAVKTPVKLQLFINICGKKHA